MNTEVVVIVRIEHLYITFVFTDWFSIKWIQTIYKKIIIVIVVVIIIIMIVILISSRPPSVEVDHGNCALSLSVRSAFLQTMPPVAYEANAEMAVLVARGADVSRCGGVSCCFLLSPGTFFDGFVGDLLFTSFRCLWRRQRQLLRSAGMSSQLSGSISKAFISRLHTSLYLSCGRPRGRSPLRMSLGILPSYLRRTWPIQRILRCLSSVYIVGRPERSRTSVFGTLSLQLMPRMQWRHRRWKLFSLRSCLL